MSELDARLKKLHELKTAIEEEAPKEWEGRVPLRERLDLPELAEETLNRLISYDAAVSAVETERNDLLASVEAEIGEEEQRVREAEAKAADPHGWQLQQIAGLLSEVKAVLTTLNENVHRSVSLNERAVALSEDSVSLGQRSLALAEQSVDLGQRSLTLTEGVHKAVLDVGKTVSAEIADLRTPSDGGAPGPVEPAGPPPEESPPAGSPYEPPDDPSAGPDVEPPAGDNKS